MITITTKGLFSLLRLPYWMMSGGLALITAFAIRSNAISIQNILLIFFSMAFITSAGFSINDYFDRESDAIIKPKRPIPSGLFSLNQVIIISGLLFIIGLFMAFLINWLSFLVLLVDSILLIFYSSYIKRKSGFAANILVGLLVGTAFLYGEATIFQNISLISISLYPICFGTISGNILRDVLSLEGDEKVGYPTLPKEIGIKKSVRLAAFFFIITAIFAPIPYFLVPFGLYYLILILIWSILLVIASVRLLTVSSTVENVRKYERMITRSMILLLLALILEAIF